MTATKTKVVICGITGSQGAAVYHALKDDPNLELVGFSRNPERAREFASGHSSASSLTVLVADLSEFESLQKAFAGADYVFGMTQPWNADYTHADGEGEVQQGKNLVGACVDNNVKHLVFSSAAHGKEKSGIPHVDSKIDIEEHIKATLPGRKIGFTILMPVQFADNVGKTFFPIQPNGWIRGFVDGDAKVPYVSCRDIGLTTKAILRDPSSHNGESIELIGDIISGDELAATVSKLRGENFQYCAVPKLLMRLFAKEFYAMRVNFESFGRDIRQQEIAKKNIEKLKKLVPELSSMEDHLVREGWASRELVSAEEKEAAQKKKRNIYALVGIASAAVAGAAIVLGRKKLGR